MAHPVAKEEIAAPTSRAEAAQEVRSGHPANDPGVLQVGHAKEGRPMKRKKGKLLRKRKAHSKKRPRVYRAKKSAPKHGRVRRKKLVAVSRRQEITDPRVARALGLMRREGSSASEAARREKMKLKTFRQRAGRYLYRSGPGKPWKARSEDQLAFSMTILTSRGPLDVIVRNSRQRKLRHRYELALRMFRAGEDGAEAALKALEGKTVGGHRLITDTNLLIQLEEAGQLDFDSLYTSFGAWS
jgi:hypothetical protein